MRHKNVDLDYAKRCVGLGWHGIIEKFYEDMNELGIDYQVDQVKEKFGGLRIYITTESEQFMAAYDIVREAEYASEVVCQNCGAPGTLRDDLSWMLTLCDACYHTASKIL